MGGATKLARLSVGLVAAGAIWGATDLDAGAATDWRPRVSAKLLSVYDSPGRARPPAVAYLKGGLGSNAGALEPRFDARGWVQADVHYDCSQDTPAKALASAGLAADTSIK